MGGERLITNSLPYPETIMTNNKQPIKPNQEGKTKYKEIKQIYQSCILCRKKKIKVELENVLNVYDDGRVFGWFDCPRCGAFYAGILQGIKGVAKRSQRK